MWKRKNMSKGESISKYSPLSSLNSIVTMSGGGLSTLLSALGKAFLNISPLNINVLESLEEQTT